MEKKCDKGWHSGGCCCNCTSQIKLTKHPWNKDFGKGSISEFCGFACIVRMDADQDQIGTFYENEHGFCELHTLKTTN